MLALRRCHEVKLQNHIQEEDEVDEAIPAVKQIRETAGTEERNLPWGEEPSKGEREAYYGIP
jgi:hypothetical protein